MEESEKDDVVALLKAIILSVAQQAAFVEKYGGILIERVPGQPKTQLCGIFTYKGHVSVEFTDGARLDDPKEVLEGGGKRRRHIKLTSVSDIVEKRCEDYLRQACRLSSDSI